MARSRDELMEVRKQILTQMEQKLHESWSSEEDSLFYCHPSEERVVLSHALSWTMTQTQCLKGKIMKEKLPSVTTFSPWDSLSKLSSPLSLPKEFFPLLRKYQEVMLDAYLLDTEDFPTLTSLTSVATRQS